MLFLTIVLGSFLLAARLSDRYQKNMLETMGMSAAALLLGLYALAVFGGLKYAGATSLIYFGYVTADIFYKKEASKAVTYLKLICSPEMILFVLTVAIVGVMTGDRIFTWWDDINYWSSDAKQLFYMGGFPGRYGNVSPEFGDYPPVTSLAKWLFLQISPDRYKESLQFVGYFALNAVFTLPLLSGVKKASAKISTAKGYGVSTAVFTILMLSTLFLFIGVFNGMIFYGTPADITMGLVYGLLLLSIYDQEDCAPGFYYLRMALYTSVLFLTKSVGFEWAVFALVFYIIFAKKSKGIWNTIIASGAVYGSWFALCLMDRRVAKLTGAGIRMATSGTYSAPDNTLAKMRYFAEGFFLWPMHGDRNLTLDISTGAAVVLIFVAIVVLHLRNLISAKEMRKLLIFAGITGLFAYGIVFLAHITIFQGEDQYLDAYAMSLSIARYGAPFTLGTTYLLLGISFDRIREKSYRSILALTGICAAFMLLTADYHGIYTYLYEYRQELEDNRAYVYDMVSDEGRAILKEVDDSRLWGKRVLILRSPENNSFVHNAYISKEASPVALVYDIWTPEDGADSLLRKIEENHAEYFIIEDGFEDYEAGRLYDLNGETY